MIPEAYYKVNRPTPEEFTNRHLYSSALIIGTGPSTELLVKYKDQLRCKFGVIIGLNFATNDFEDILDYHMIMEKDPDRAYTEMHRERKRFRDDLPRILNWKTLDKFPQDLNIYKAVRTNFGFKHDIEKYNHNGCEGLLVGPQDPKGLSSGTVMLNAMHFACIMGCVDIYMIGADLMFKGANDHYYPDNNFYRKSQTKPANRSPIVKTKYKGKDVETTEFFVYSAKYIDEIVDQCKKLDIDVYDFSDGLLEKPIKLDLDEFFGEE